MAPLQKRALYSLIIGVALTAVFVVVLLLQGDLTAFDDNQDIRMVMYVALIGVPLVFTVLVNLTMRNPNRYDERDRQVFEKSHRFQSGTAVITMAAWTVTLTEIYWDQGQMPIAYLNLVFVSILIMSTLGQSLGIVLGYRRLSDHG